MPTGLHVYRFTKRGVVTPNAERMVPSTTTIGQILASPVAYIDVTLDDAVADPEPDISSGMADLGYALHEVDPETGPAWAELQRSSDVLGADAAAIVPADGWVDVLVVTIKTNGASVLDVSGMPVFTCVTDGEYRLLVNDGVGDTVIVDPLAVDVTSNRKAHAIQASYDVPFTATDTTYDVKLQAQTAAGSVTPKKDSFLMVIERKLQDEVAP